jgi:hypothetical protein
VNVESQRAYAARRGGERGVQSAATACPIACVIALVWQLAQTAAAQPAANPQGGAGQGQTPGQTPTTGQTQTAGQAPTDEELAERALDRTLVSTGVVLLPPGILEIEPNLLYVRNEQSAPGIFTDTTGAVYVSEQRLNQDSLNAAVQLRLGLPAETQVEVYVPYAYAHEEQVTDVGLAPRSDSSSHLSGIGDVNLAIAKTLLVERTGQPNLVARLSWDTGTGRIDQTQGLTTGSGFSDVTFSLLATKRQDPLVFLGGPYYEKSFSKAGIELGDRIGLTFGAALAASPETSLRIVLNQAFVGNEEVSGEVQHGSNENIGVITFGASMTFGAGKFLDFTIQEGLTRDAPKLAFGIALSVRLGTPWRSGHG